MIPYVASGPDIFLSASSYEPQSTLSSLPLCCGWGKLCAGLDLLLVSRSKLLTEFIVKVSDRCVQWTVSKEVEMSPVLRGTHCHRICW